MFAHGSGGIEAIMAEMAWWQEQEDGWSHHICTRETVDRKWDQAVDLQAPTPSDPTSPSNVPPLKGSTTTSRTPGEDQVFIFLCLWV